MFTVVFDPHGDYPRAGEIEPSSARPHMDRHALFEERDEVSGHRHGRRLRVYVNEFSGNAGRLRLYRTETTE